tara:strand:+ start:4389 stop:5768 length:1380 start_codon:yes stop_codon:yes gene_type:complete
MSSKPITCDVVVHQDGTLCGLPQGRVKSRTWCKAHNDRWNRKGDVDGLTPIRAKLPQPAICIVDGCEKPTRAKCLCATHYARKEKTGTTDRLRGGDPRACLHCGKTYHATVDRRRGLCHSCYEDIDIARQYGKKLRSEPRRPKDYWKNYSCIGKKRDGSPCDREVVTGRDGKHFCSSHDQMDKKYGRVEYLPKVRGTCKIDDDTCGKSYYGHGYCTVHWRRKKLYGDPHKTHPRTNMQPSDEKVCTKCHTLKPIDEYAASKNSYDGKTAKCKACISEEGRIYRNKPENREKIRANRKRWYEENKESERQKSIEWGKANPDRVIESRKKYQENHRQELCERSKAYRLANIEKVSRKDQERTRIYRARKANAVSDEHTIPELHQYWRTKGIDPKRCTYCDAWHTQWGHSWKRSQGDHVVPLNKGGTDMMGNMVPCCVSCNASKSDKILYEEWVPPKERKAS